MHVRTWPYLTKAALEAYHAVPQPTDVGRHIERIALAGDGLHEANQRHRTWPGPGAADPAVAQVVYALAAAAQDGGGLRTASQSKEAERLIGETLWMSANTAGEPLRDHLRDLGRTVARGPNEPAMRLDYRRAHDAFGRLTAAENMAASLVAGRTIHPRASAGALAEAVATWDVEAHRSLLTQRSTSTLALISRREAAVQKAFATAVGHASSVGAIDAHTAERIEPVLGSLTKAWTDLADRSHTLIWGPQIVPRSTVEAGAELGRAFKTITLEREEPHGQAAILSALNSHLASSVALAAAARELIHDRELIAPARAINAAVLKHNPTLRRTTVSPVDMLQGRSVSLPAEARDILQEPADAVYYESEEAMHRGAGLDSLHRQAEPAIPANVPDTGPSRPVPPLPGLGINPQPLTPPL